MVEGARLESVYRGNSIEGSNPSLSARFSYLFSATSHPAHLPVHDFELKLGQCPRIGFTADARNVATSGPTCVHPATAIVASAKISRSRSTGAISKSVLNAPTALRASVDVSFGQRISSTGNRIVDHSIPATGKKHSKKYNISNMATSHNNRIASQSKPPSTRSSKIANSETSRRKLFQNIGHSNPGLLTSPPNMKPFAISAPNALGVFAQLGYSLR